MKGPSDLELSFLYDAMNHMHRLPYDTRWVNSMELADFLPEEIRRDERKAVQYLSRHLEYLKEKGLLRWKSEIDQDVLLGIELTARGREFVQPELAQFASALTSNLVREVEKRIDESNLPSNEKKRFMYRLREAISGLMPDVATKVIVEILNRIGQM